MPAEFFGILGIVLIFGAIIVFHEFGHYIVAKLSGMEVYEFAIGLGPAIFKKKIGETIYALRIIPVGGFVRIAGMELDENDSPRGYDKKPFWAKYATLAAGATMNFVLAFLLIVTLGMAVGYPQSGKKLLIAGVMPKSPAAKAGMKQGDIVVQAGNLRNPTHTEVSELIANSPQPVRIVVDREGKEFVFRPKPDNVKFPEQDVVLYAGEKPAKGAPDHRTPLFWLYRMEDKHAIGVMFETSSGVFQRIGFGKALEAGVTRVGFTIVDGFSQFASLALGRIPIDQIGGPVQVMKVSYDASSEAVGSSFGWFRVISTAGLLSALIGLFNLLPIPALDGGRLFFLIIGGILRKPIDREKEEKIHGYALMALLGFILLITIKDVVGLFGG